VAAVDGAGALLAHRGPHLGRARPRDRVQLRRVPGAGGVGRLQRPRGTLSHLLGWSGQPSPEPGVSEGRVGRHPGGGLPLQTPPDEVKEERVITTLEGGLQLPGAGGPPGLASPRPASVEDCGAVREGGGRAVARVAFRGYEIFCSLRLV